MVSEPAHQAALHCSDLLWELPSGPLQEAWLTESLQEVAEDGKACETAADLISIHHSLQKKKKKPTRNLNKTTKRLDLLSCTLIIAQIAKKMDLVTFLKHIKPHLRYRGLNLRGGGLCWLPSATSFCSPADSPFKIIF